MTWWHDAVFYQVYPRSFADSDGDGLGDLPGVTSRLGYLAELGVDALWLSPFYTSPQADAGYDVADFRDVDPRFGALADFDRLVEEAHRVGLRIVVDLVPNHTSDRHPWFQEALRAGPGSRARRRYHFRDGGEDPPNNWPSVFGGPAWTKVEDGQWYLHLFDSAQPDLNWEEPEVRREFESVLRFWLDRGADGFRVDVAHGLVKEPGLPDRPNGSETTLLGGGRTPYFDVDGVHEIYRSWRRILDSYPGERMAVAEAWVESPERRARYVRPDELHQAFNFDLLSAPFSAPEFRKTIDAELELTADTDAPPTWVLSNHDRQRHPTRYGGGELGSARARAATLAMLALPGSAYLYQGEELGLPEVLDLEPELRQDPVFRRTGGEELGRDGCRVPLPWTRGGPSLGFGSEPGWLPQPPEWSRLSAEAQDGDPDSTLSFYREALRLRRRLRPGRTVAWREAPRGDAEVLDFDNGAVRCVINFGATPLDLSGTPLLSSSPLTDGRLPGAAAVWLER